MRREQARRNRRGITAIQPDWCRIHDQIDIRDLKTKRRFLPANRLQTRHWSENFWTFEKTSQRIDELLPFFERAVRDHEPFAVFLRALERDRARRTTGAKNENTHVSQVD